MKVATPIKRSKCLQPLSREHHQGLLFAWKIQQGLRNQVALEEMYAYASWFWEQHLSPHFILEEKYLQPLLPADDPLLLRMMEEHVVIGDLIPWLKKKSDPDQLSEFAELLESHIRFEEREFFPYLEEKLDSRDIENLAALELEVAPECEEWKNEFWIGLHKKDSTR